MPTYDYLCDTCGHHFEHFQSMNEAKLEVCPRCQASVRRLIGAGSGIIFKGSGFYCTDYRSASEAAKYASGGKPSSATESSSSSKDKGNAAS
ncbi:MAG: zinc ribbon domain-containing protein [Lentisphaeria bacterium]|jgi:putative FmdB family regulatory protein|nr:zinc ribbon domain-containing protein [Lentisphaeria bacterium]MDY0175552.1 zinc ribbon domain-containing protein [Lentisphaeria bacterium]NLZ59027.1 hypothetical protein [Lentisphaerota bacterium]